MWFVVLLGVVAAFLAITGLTVYTEPEPFIGAAVMGGLAVAGWWWDQKQKRAAAAREREAEIRRADSMRDRYPPG